MLKLLLEELIGSLKSSAGTNVESVWSARATPAFLFDNLTVTSVQYIIQAKTNDLFVKPRESLMSLVAINLLHKGTH